MYKLGSDDGPLPHLAEVIRDVLERFRGFWVGLETLCFWIGFFFGVSIFLYVTWEIVRMLNPFSQLCEPLRLDSEVYTIGISLRVDSDVRPNLLSPSGPSVDVPIVSNPTNLHSVGRVPGLTDTFDSPSRALSVVSPESDDAVCRREVGGVSAPANSVARCLDGMDQSTLPLLVDVRILSFRLVVILAPFPRYPVCPPMSRAPFSSATTC